MTIRNQEEFVAQLKQAAKTRYNIDIYELKRQLSGHVLELSGQITNEASHQILVKNLEELYQEYLQNTQSPELYFNHLVDGYKYLLDMSILQECKKQFTSYINEQTEYALEQTGLNTYALIAPGIYPQKQIHMQKDILDKFPYDDFVLHKDEFEAIIQAIIAEFKGKLEERQKRSISTYGVEVPYDSMMEDNAALEYHGEVELD